MQVLDADGATRLYAHDGPGAGDERRLGGQHDGGGRGARRPRRLRRPGRGRSARRDLHPRHPGARRRVRHPAESGGAPTGRCLILVTPDAQRTMNTFRGAAHELERRRARSGADPRARRSSIWKPISGARRARARRWSEAMAIAHAGGPQGRLHPLRHRLHQAASRGDDGDAGGGGDRSALRQRE